MQLPSMPIITTPSTPYPSITAVYQSARLQRLGNSADQGDTIGQVLTDLEDLAQSIRIILTTPKGSDPLRPEFATDIYRLIDRPLAEVRLLLVRECVNALRNFEPRISVDRVEILGFGDRAGIPIDSIYAVVHWPPLGGAETVATAVVLA